METIAETLKRIQNGVKVIPPTPEPEDSSRSIVTLATLNPNWHPMVKTAVRAARQWQQSKRAQADNGLPAHSSLVLVAAAVPGDIDRTGYGCGKTHIARSCLWSSYYVKDGEPVAPDGKFFMASDLLLRMDGESTPRDEIKGSPVLVIDDVGAEGELPYIKAERQAAERQARYFRIIDYCYRHQIDGDDKGTAVIITGNLTLPELAAHIGGRAWSRLLEMAPTGQMVDLTGVPDYRRSIGGR